MPWPCGARVSAIAGGRFTYERAIRRSGLPAPARHLALTIATWAAVDTAEIPERFQPSLTTLEEATGLSRATVKRHLSVLEAAGWLGRDRPDVIKARTEHARTGYRLRIPDGAGLTESLGSDRAQPGLTVSPDLGSQRTQPGLTVSPKSSFSSSSPGSPSLSTAAPDPPVTPVPAEREIKAPPKGTPTAAQRAVRAAGVVSPEEEAAFIGWCTAKFLVQGPGWWRVCAADLPEHAAAWRADRPGGQAPGPALPPWCGSCGDGGAAARTNPRFRTVVVLGTKVPCPDCHPGSGLSLTRAQ